MNGAGEAAVAGQRDDRHRALLAPLEQRQAVDRASRRRAVPTISSSMRSAYGRIASIRACARRSRAEATSSIAFVILRVLRTERIRRLMSWTEATAA